MSIESRLKTLAIELPPPPQAIGAYRTMVRSGNLAYLSGHLPLGDDGSLVTGKVGRELDQAAGYDAARRAGLSMLATLREELGRLDRVRRVVKLTGFVNATDDFTEHPAVINGCSELMAQVFGEQAGVAARSAVGAASLPKNVAVEMEGIFEIQ